MEDGGLNGEQRVLVVFDYDWSLVNENSDRYIFEVLYPELLATLRSRHGETPWTQLMDELLQELAADRPHITRAQIEATVAQIPVQDKMLDALKLAAEHPDGMVAIVSDANTVYIESMLAHHQLSGHVTKLVTNPAHWEPLSETTHRLRVQPYHSANQQPHACANCPVNMCKGVILDELRREHPSARVLYIGDGGGDFCPATRLTKNDIVFARASEPDGISFALLKRLERDADQIQAQVIPWRTGHDIFTHFAEVFNRTAA